MNIKHLLIAAACGTMVYGCSEKKQSPAETEENNEVMTEQKKSIAEERVEIYETVKLTADLDHLSSNQKEMIKKLIEAAKLMDDMFWYEAYGQKDSLMNTLSDEATRKFVSINYGPWDRLNDNEPFIEGVGKKPATANFYPQDMTKEEFEKADLKDKDSQYTFLRRNDKGELYTIPYHEMFPEKVKRASELLKEASELAEDKGLKNYLQLRAQALLTDEYRKSDMAWMDMKSNPIDVVIGPIENYEDKLFGYKSAHEGYVLIKDMEWSEKLAKYANYLPELQRNLPIEAKYKKDKIGTDADLNAYDVVYYAGDCNAGSKTIAINLPNDEVVQQKKGTRRLQLKNAMRAKFDKIMVPISEVLIADDQREHVTFDAFFANTMFHEVAHGLGIKNTIDGKGTVRSALKEHASALEEGKADILGLYMIHQLHKKGELSNDMKDYYVTFLAGIFRSVRFGAASAHGTANMIRFNYFRDQGAFERNEETGQYSVNFDKMEAAMNSLSEKILKLQGDGDYEGVGQFVAEKGKITDQLQKDLNRLSENNIPVDIVFEQGVDVLGLENM